MGLRKRLRQSTRDRPTGPARVWVGETNGYLALKKLPKRYGALVVPFLLSLFMTCVVSAISVIRTLGFTTLALAAWPSAWFLSWVVAFPVLLVVMPFVRRLARLVVED